MVIGQTDIGTWIIWHGGHRVKKEFSSEREANRWADSNIDDQVFDSPNWFSGPIEYVENLPNNFWTKP
jgi:hypothetical protein